jgi:hypothetical protein
LVEISNQFFKDEKQFKSILFDIDIEEILPICDVIYIDSVLTMLENPLIILDKLMNSCEYIFINRTDLGFTDTIKTSSQWGGMDKNSTFWQFSSKTIIDFVDKNNCSLKELQNGVFVIKSNKKK